MAGRTPPDNPYLAARSEWNERYGSYVKAASAWRIVGITGMAMAVVGFTYSIYQSTQVKLVPYIVEVDKLGTAVTAGFPQQIEYADPRVVRATLGGFVSNFRSVTPDAVVQTSTAPPTQRRRKSTPGSARTPRSKRRRTPRSRSR
jgi:type IV secretory pathway TrbF-like protein